MAPDVVACWGHRGPLQGLDNWSVSVEPEYIRVAKPSTLDSDFAHERVVQSLVPFSAADRPETAGGFQSVEQFLVDEEMASVVRRENAATSDHPLPHTVDGPIDIVEGQNFSIANGEAAFGWKRGVFRVRQANLKGTSLQALALVVPLHHRVHGENEGEDLVSYHRKASRILISVGAGDPAPAKDLKSFEFVLELSSFEYRIVSEHFSDLVLDVLLAVTRVAIVQKGKYYQSTISRLHHHSRLAWRDDGNAPQKFDRPAYPDVEVHRQEQLVLGQTPAILPNVQADNYRFDSRNNPVEDSASRFAASRSGFFAVSHTDTIDDRAEVKRTTFAVSLEERVLPVGNTFESGVLAHMCVANAC